MKKKKDRGNCQSVQTFTTSQKSWPSQKPRDDETVTLFFIINCYVYWPFHRLQTFHTLSRRNYGVNMSGIEKNKKSYS